MKPRSCWSTGSVPSGSSSPPRRRSPESPTHPRTMGWPPSPRIFREPDPEVPRPCRRSRAAAGLRPVRAGTSTPLPDSVRGVLRPGPTPPCGWAPSLAFPSGPWIIPTGDLSSEGPQKLEDTGRGGVPSQHALPGLNEGEALLDTEITDELGYEDLSRVGRIADPTGKVYRRSEYVVVVIDRFAGSHADPDPKLRRAAPGGPRLEPDLDRRGALEGMGDIVERRHDPVAGVLHLASSRGHESASDDEVVLGEQDHVRRLSELLKQRRRTLQVREKDRSECTCELSGVDGICDLAQEPQDVVFRDADDLIGDQAVRLSVDSLHVLSPTRPSKAERLTVVGIEPVGEELHAVFGLQPEITPMSLRDLLCGCAGKVMTVHEERHVVPSFPRLGFLARLLRLRASSS